MTYLYLDKHLDRLYKEGHSPYVLVLKEKHGSYYLDASTREALFASCLSVVKGRVKADHWYYEPEEPESKPAMTRAAALALPAGRVKTAAMQEIQHHEDSLRQLAQDREDWELLLHALAGDGRLAYYFLSSRKDAEYEGFDLEEVSKKYG